MTNGGPESHNDSTAVFLCYGSWFKAKMSINSWSDLSNAYNKWLLGQVGECKNK